MLLNVTKREIGTALAALRHWQQLGLFKIDGPEMDIATDGKTQTPLDEKEIDKLCEKLNYRPAKKKGE